MELSSALVKSLASITNDSTSNSASAVAYGTAVVSGDKVYVQLDGSNILTSISVTTDVRTGDRVLVSIENHVATIVSNLTTPASGYTASETAAVVQDVVNEVTVLKNGATTIYCSETVPSTADFSLVTNDLWYMPTTTTDDSGESYTSYTLYRWTGDTWALVEFGSDSIAAKSIIAEKISVANLASINANLGAITGGSLNIGNGTFIVTSDGNLTANSGSFSGKITSSEGTIGGFTIGDYKIYGGDSDTGTVMMQLPERGTYVFAAGGTSHTNYSDCPFRVTPDGKIYAECGTIGPLTISNSTDTNATSGHHTAVSAYMQQYGYTATVWDGTADNATTTATIDLEFAIKNPGSNLNYAAMYLLWKKNGLQWTNANDLVMFKVSGYGRVMCTGIEIYPNRAIMSNDGDLSYYDSELRCCYTDNEYINFDFVKFVESNSNTGAMGAIYSDIDPYDANVKDLGGSAFYWRRIYVGTVYRTSESNLSDLKLKQNITPLDDNYTNFIMGLEPISYDFINGDTHRKHLGFGAQPVRDAAYKTVGDLALFKAQVDGDDRANYEPGKYTDDEVTWGLSYDEFIAPMVKMLQDLRREMDDVKRQLTEVRNGKHDL